MLRDRVLFAVLWIAALLAGMTFKTTARFLGWPAPSQPKSGENRPLMSKPDFRNLPVKEWGRACDAWYNDHFAFRPAVVDLYRELHFRWFKSPVKRFVPGRGIWLFGRMGHDGNPGDVWPEVEDYMGIVKLDEKMIDDWKTLFEGRVAWAEAHGFHYLEVLLPMKASVHPEKMLPMITWHKKDSCREELRTAVEMSTATSNVLFLAESLQAEVASGREVFYEEDHHENAYGCYCIFRDIVSRMRELWYPEIGVFPFFEREVPSEVKDGLAPGCWVTEERRLAVRNPDMKVIAKQRFGIVVQNPKFPHGGMCVARPGAGIKILAGHDSFLRYPLESWYTARSEEFAVPFGDGIAQVIMLLFRRFTTGRLEDYIADELPDVVMEQFSEGRLQFGTNGKGYDFLDDTMRRAAAWSHGVPCGADDTAGASGLMAVAVLDGLRVSGSLTAVTVELRDGEENLLASEAVKPGIRRAVFFGDIPAASGLHVVLVDGAADAVRLEFRTR